MPRKEKNSSFAILSDIHANIDALEAVLEDIASRPCRGILCLGDIVGYGAAPAACVQRMMEDSAVTVMGNHDAMLFLVEKVPIEEFGQTVGEPLLLASRQMSDAQKKWLRALPIAADLDPITLSHASLHEPASFHYIDGELEAEAHLAIQTSPVSFQGHTHVPAIWRETECGVEGFQPSVKPLQLDEHARYAINVGSVGQPRDRDPRACYVLYDFESRLLLHRRIPYDIERAQRRIEEAGLPAGNASRLATGR